MIAYAAIDLRGGRVVQLVGGRPEAERISLPDPDAVARQWIECGFAGLHVVDLDAALGSGTNDDEVRAVLQAASAAGGTVPVQVGGGVRTTERVRALLDAGAARVVVGTRAVEEPAWLEELAVLAPGRIVLAADVREGQVVVRGWTADAGISADTLMRRVAALPLAAVLVTDVSREGSMKGVDVAAFRDLADTCAQPLIASGGVADVLDLGRLERAGAAGAVLGMALYTGALDAREVAEKYNA